MLGAIRPDHDSGSRIARIPATLGSYDDAASVSSYWHAKNGTTALPSFLKSERAFLLKQNVYYPATQADNRHTMLVRAIGAPLNAVRGRAPRRDDADSLEQYLEQFTDEIRSLPEAVDKVIVSSEHFAAYPTLEHVERLQKFLAPLFGLITVIVYLRRQDAHFASGYTQTLRLGHIDAPNLEQSQDRRHVYDFDQMLGHWADAFGVNAIVPRIFERYPGRKFDILEEFAQLCGFTLPAEMPEFTRNPSISLAGQHVLLLLGRKLQEQTSRQGVWSSEWHRITKAVTMEAKGTGWQPTQDEARAFVARFAASNEAARARWFPQRPTLFNDDYSFLPEHPVVPDPAEVTSVLCNVLLRVMAKEPDRGRGARGEKSTARGAEREPNTEVVAFLENARLHLKEGDVAQARISLDDARRVSPTHKGALRLERKLNARIAGGATGANSAA
jgi:hypothetical protein